MTILLLQRSIGCVRSLVPWGLWTPPFGVGRRRIPTAWHQGKCIATRFEVFLIGGEDRTAWSVVGFGLLLHTDKGLRVLHQFFSGLRWGSSVQCADGKWVSASGVTGGGGNLYVDRILPFYCGVMTIQICLLQRWPVRTLAMTMGSMCAAEATVQPTTLTWTMWPALPRTRTWPNAATAFQPVSSAMVAPSLPSHATRALPQLVSQTSISSSVKPMNWGHQWQSSFTSTLC
jgi:hypothetical protein